MARLGADVTLIGKIGRDQMEKKLIKVCKEAGVYTQNRILYDDTLPTGSSIVLLEKIPDGK